jgi:hypothetical protein
MSFVWSVLGSVLYTPKICDPTPVHTRNTPQPSAQHYHITTGIDALLLVGSRGSRPALGDLQTGTGGAYVRVCTACFFSHTPVKIACGAIAINQVVGMGF